MKIINNTLIRNLKPCYDPSKYIKDKNENLSVLEWVNKYRSIVPDKDIIWLLCRNEFMSDKELRLFAVWCTREALKLVNNPNPRSIEACNVAERYANGNATDEELDYAYRASVYNRHDVPNTNVDFYVACTAQFVVYPTASIAAYSTTLTATRAAHNSAYNSMSINNIRAIQLNKLLTYFK